MASLLLSFDLTGIYRIEVSHMLYVLSLLVGTFGEPTLDGDYPSC